MMTSEQIVESLMGDNYLMINRDMVMAWSLPEASFLCELVYKRKGLKKFDNLPKDEFFFYTQKKIEETLNISCDSQLKYTKNFIERGILEVKLEGNSPFNRKKLFKINFDRIVEVLSTKINSNEAKRRTNRNQQL